MKWVVYSLLFIVFSCISKNEETTNWQQYKKLRTDTLKAIVNNLPSNLTFTLQELDEIMESVKVDVDLINTLDLNKLNEEDKQYVAQYIRMQTIGSNCIPEYKKAIANVDEGLSLYAAFDKLIHTKDNNANVDFFKEEYLIVKKDMYKLKTQIDEAGQCSKMFHASYIRLSRKMDDILPN